MNPWRTTSLTLANNNCAQHTLTDPVSEYAWTLQQARSQGVPEANLSHPKIVDAVKRGEQLVLLRTSTNPSVALAFTLSEWQAMLGGIRKGEWDLSPEAEAVAEKQLASQH